MPSTPSLSLDQPQPPDEIVDDLASLPRWDTDECGHPGIYKGVIVAKYVYRPDTANRVWKRELHWTLAPQTGKVVTPAYLTDRKHVLGLANAHMMKQLAQLHPAMTTSPVNFITDPEFKASFARFLAVRKIHGCLTRAEHALQAVGFRALRDNAAAMHEAYASTARQIVQAAMQAAIDAIAFDNELQFERTPVPARALAKEVPSSHKQFPLLDIGGDGGPTDAKAMDMPVMERFASTPAGGNEIVPAAVDFANGVDRAHKRELDTFGPAIAHAVTPMNEMGGWRNRDGELDSPIMIGGPMSEAIKRWLVPNLNRWAANTPFFKRREALRREEQCPALI